MLTTKEKHIRLTHLGLNKLVLLLEKFQVRVDEVEVVLGSDVVAPAQLVFKISTEGSNRDVHLDHVCDDSLAETLRHQWILQHNYTLMHLLQLHL